MFGESLEIILWKKKVEEKLIILQEFGEKVTESFLVEQQNSCKIFNISAVWVLKFLTHSFPKVNKEVLKD